MSKPEPHKHQGELYQTLDIAVGPKIAVTQFFRCKVCKEPTLNRIVEHKKNPLWKEGTDK